MLCIVKLLLLLFRVSLLSFEGLMIFSEFYRLAIRKCFARFSSGLSTNSLDYGWLSIVGFVSKGKRYCNGGGGEMIFLTLTSVAMSSLRISRSGWKRRYFMRSLWFCNCKGGKDPELYCLFSINKILN